MSINPESEFEVDEVLIQREKIRKRVKVGKQVGYGAMTISVVSFALCLVLKWPAWLAITSMVSFVISCIVLPLPIIFGYAIKAAEKEDRKLGL